MTVLTFHCFFFFLVGTCKTKDKIIHNLNKSEIRAKIKIANIANTIFYKSDWWAAFEVILI